MPEHKQNYEKTRITVLLGAASWLFLCSFTMADPDLWGHTLYGIRAIEQGVLVERTDPFSYTAGGDPWINHEWATEYEFGWLWTHFGNSGLIVWKFVILGGMIAWLTWQLCKSESNLGARLMLFTFTTLCLGNFVVYIRPQLVTFLLFPIFLTILRRTWESWSNFAWLLPVLTMLWVNHHGGFLAGVALTGYFSGLAWIRAWGDRSEMKAAVKFTGVSLASIAATFVTPYGFELHRMLWIHLGTDQVVREWQAVWAVGFSWVYATPFLILFFAISLSRNWKWIDFLTLFLIAIQAAVHLRHIALLCLAEMVILPMFLTGAVRNSFPQLCQRWGAPESARLRWGGVFVAMSFLFFLQVRSAVPLWQSGLKPWDIAVETTSGVPGMPTRAVRFLTDHNLQGNIVTDYGWAQFVIWQTFPESKVGFDGRYRTVYSALLEQEFLSFQRTGDEQPEKTPFLDKYPTQIALLPDETGPVPYLEQRLDWQRIYRDGQARIYVKKDFFTEAQLTDLQVEILEIDGSDWEIFPTSRTTGTKIAE